MATDTPLIHQLLEQLELEGVSHVFGVPGGPLSALFEALKARGRMRFVLARHEAGAAFMANAHARVRGEPAVCCVTSGPGATNALTGVAAAHADSLPVLYLTGQVATGMFGLGAIQESTWHGVDVVEILRPITKLSAMVVTAQMGMRMLRHALRTATTGRHGPVHLNLPADLARVKVPYEVREPASYRPRCVSVARAEDVAQYPSDVVRRDRPPPKLYKGSRRIDDLEEERRVGHARRGRDAAQNTAPWELLFAAAPQHGVGGASRDRRDPAGLSDCDGEGHREADPGAR